MSEKLNAIIYCRVSTDDQAENGLSIESQEKVCLEKAKLEGCSVLEILKDEGKSAGTLKRPGIQRIIELAQTKKIDAVITVHSDRLARNIKDHLELRELFRKQEVKLIYVQLPKFDGSASSKVSDSMLAAMNQYHRDITSEKVSMTMKEKAQAGYFPGRAPLGYDNVENPKSENRFGRRIILPNKQAPLIREMFELYATGNYNVFDLNDKMFEKGLRTKKGAKVHDSIIYTTLKNRFYIGELHWGGVHVVEGKHPAIIDKTVFNRVQSTMIGNNHHRCRRHKYSWLLSGYVKCYKHECRYTAEWHLDKKIAYYHCTNKNGCGRYIEIGKLEEMVSEKFKDLELDQSFIDEVLGKTQTLFIERRKEFDRKRSSLVSLRTAFEAKKRVAENKLLEGVITDEEFTRINSEMVSEILCINNQLKEIESFGEANIDVLKRAMEMTKDLYNFYLKAPFEIKRRLLSLFWECFEVADGVIIKSCPSELFKQLLELKKIRDKSKNSVKPNESLKVINFKKLSAQ